jgi:hypothetical protein
LCQYPGAAVYRGHDSAYRRLWLRRSILLAPSLPADDSRTILEYPSGGFSHAFIVGAAAAFGDFPIDYLVRIGDVAGFTVDAVGGIDF